MGQLRQQLPLIRHRRGQPGLPVGIDIDVAGGAGAHAAADRRDSIVELPQGLHDLETGLRLDLMLLTVAIDHTQQRHHLPLVNLQSMWNASGTRCRQRRCPGKRSSLPINAPWRSSVARSSRRSVSKTRSYSPKICVLRLPLTTLRSPAAFTRAMKSWITGAKRSASG